MGGMAILAGAAALGAVSSISSGVAQRSAYKMEAMQAGLDAKSAEIERRGALQDALAMQSVIAGASGRAPGEGSLQTIREADIQKAEEDIKLIKLGGGAKSAALTSAGSTALTSGIISGLASAGKAGYAYSQVK